MPSWKVSGLSEIEFLLHQDPSNYSDHIHEGFNIDYLQAGRLEYRIGVKNFLMRHGNFVWIQPYAVHGARALSKSVRIKSLLLSESYVHDVAPEMKGRELNMEPVIGDRRLGKQIERIHNLSRISSNALEIETRLVEVLALFLSVTDLTENVSTHNDAVNTMKDYLLAHYAENVSLGMLANLVKLNRYYLVRVFKSHVGLPPYSYLTQIRVAKARNLLLSGMSLTEVAAAVGFSDQSHLTRFFKHCTGKTPGSFRFATNRDRREILRLW